MNISSSTRWESLFEPLLWARVVAAENGGSEIRPQDLLLGLFRGPMENSPEQPLWQQLRLPASIYNELCVRIYGSVRTEPIAHGDFPLTDDSKSVLSQAVSIAEGRNQEIRPVHILLCFFSHPDKLLRSALTEIGITQEGVVELIVGGEFS